MELSNLFLSEMGRIINSHYSEKDQSVNTKLLDLYLDESLTGPLDLSDKLMKHKKIIKMLTLLYPVSFTQINPDLLENPKILENLRKSKNISSDIKKDLRDISDLIEVSKIPKIYKELGIKNQEYMKRLPQIRLKKILKKGLRDFEKAHKAELGKEKADIRKSFRDLELQHLDPLIYIAEILDQKEIGFEALNVFMDPESDPFNTSDRKNGVIEYKKALIKDYLEHLEKFPKKKYSVNIKEFELRLFKRGNK
jgi:hypothetical protein